MTLASEVKAFYSTNTKMVKIISVIIAALILVALYLGNARSAAIDKQKLQDQISELKRQMAARDTQIALANAQIKVRDDALAALRKKDSALAIVAVQKQAALDSSRQSVNTLKAAIDSDAVTHQSLVPLVQVHALELKYDGQVKSCEDLKTTDEARISNLLGQVDSLTKTRKQLDSNVAALDSNVTASKTITADTEKELRPPWWRRTISWVGDHTVTLLIGAAGGIVISKVAKL